jgi:hypothetical protein
MPSIPTLPFDHGCVPAQAMQFSRSSVSRGELQSITPGDQPAPRESTRITT